VDESTEAGSSPTDPKLIFESYGRVDAAELAERLHRDLEADGYAVWRDTEEIKHGSAWATKIERAIATSDVLVALLSPHAVRSGSDKNDPDAIDSVCLDEIFLARFGKPPRPIVPVMAVSCQPPLPIFRLDYVDLTKWKASCTRWQTGRWNGLSSPNSIRLTSVRFSIRSGRIS
jgi:hypothetical protein